MSIKRPVRALAPTSQRGDWQILDDRGHLVCDFMTAEEAQEIAAALNDHAALQARVAALEAERDDWLPWTTWHRMPGLCWACQEWKTIDTRIRYHGSDRRRSQEETVCTHCGQRRHVDRREWGPRPTAEWGTAAIVGGAGEGVQP